MTPIQLPSTVETVFQEFFTCEFTTIAKDGTPITWPILPIYRPALMQFVIMTPIGLAQKTLNIRRNPRVSLLFSDPTGSDLISPPAVLVQGDAEAPDEILPSFAALDEDLRTAMEMQARKLFRRQPAVASYTSNPLMRYLFDWYFMRLTIYITPRRILWWDAGDFTRTPYELEVEHVA